MMPRCPRCDEDLELEDMYPHPSPEQLARMQVPGILGAVLRCYECSLNGFESYYHTHVDTGSTLYPGKPKAA